MMKTQTSKWPWNILFAAAAVALLFLLNKAATQDPREVTGLERTAHRVPEPNAPVRDLSFPPEGEETVQRLLEGTRAQVPTADPQAMRLRIESRAIRGFSSEPAANIAFELFLGSPGPNESRIYRGRTDESGRCALDLNEKQLRPGLEDQGDRVTCRVIEPGYMQTLRWFSWSPGVQTTHELVLSVRPGGTLRGQLVNGAGQGVSGSLHFVAWTPDVVAKTWKSPFGGYLGEPDPGRAHADQGYFELHVPASGSGTLVAECGAEGGAELSGVRVNCFSPQQDLLVVVGSEGVLRGKVVDSRGHGVGGVFLIISRESASSAGGSPEEGQRKTQTDEHGFFEASVLRPGKYFIHAKAAFGGVPKLLTDQPVLADGTHLSLQWSRPHMVIRLLDSTGTPLHGIHHLMVYLDGEFTPAVMPEYPVLIVTAVDDQGPELGLLGRMNECDAGKDGRFYLDVRDGQEYNVAAIGDVFDGTPQRVFVRHGSEAVHVEVRAPAQ